MPLFLFLPAGLVEDDQHQDEQVCVALFATAIRLHEQSGTNGGSRKVITVRNGREKRWLQQTQLMTVWWQEVLALPGRSHFTC